jgi:hypothetical protein
MNESLEMMKAMASLFRKKAAVMQALEGGIAKSGENTHFNYKFMTASEIKHTVGRLFAQHGISLSMSGIATESAVTLIEKKDFKTKETSVKEVAILRIQFQISLCDVDTGAVEQSFWFGEAGAGDDKAASKAATSALKYYLISNLLIADKEEDKRDTDNQKRRPAEDQPAPRPQQSASNAHWSTDSNLMNAMYKWAMDTHKASRNDVHAAISATGKTLPALERDEVKAAVANYVSKKKAS